MIFRGKDIGAPCIPLIGGSCVGRLGLGGEFPGEMPLITQPHQHPPFSFLTIVSLSFPPTHTPVWTATKLAMHISSWPRRQKPTATAQPSMTDFFEKKAPGSKPAAKPASSTTARKPSTKPPPKKATAKKAAQGSDDDISMDELQLESAAPVAPRATAPRRAAAAAVGQ